MNDLERKNAVSRLEVKAQEDGKMKIRAYALAFNNVDSYGDVIEPTACDRWLASEDAKRCALCYQHNFDEVIGVITDKGVDTYGMWIEADILPTTTGKDVQTLINAGAVKEFSIGYRVHDYAWVVKKVGDTDLEVRSLKDISVLEVSPVTRAANPKAVLVDVKGEMSRMSDDELCELRNEIEAEYMRRVINQFK